MKIFITLLILFVVNGARGQLNGNCDVEGIDANTWTTAFQSDRIDDNEHGLLISKTTENVVSCRGTSVYFNVACDTNILNISTSSEFVNYELKEKHTSIPVIVSNIEFVCAVGTGTLKYYQYINDLNTYVPHFHQPSYTFKLPMPLPEGINLQCLNNVEIEACDDDISNLKLDFEVDPPDFLITMESPSDERSRCFTAKITAAIPLNLDKNTNYSLIVKDDGNPIQNGHSILAIEIDEDTALPSNPQFSSAYYTGIYDNTDDNHKVNFEEIKLIKNYPNLDLKLIGGQANYFDVSHAEGIVTVALKSKFPPEIIEENVFIILTLEAAVPKAEAPGRTALIISMPTKECPTTTTSLPTTACPTTESPTECPICTTEQPITTTVCPTTETPTECPPCTTEAITITSCPPSSTEQPTGGPTECPITSTEACPTQCPECPTTITPTKPLVTFLANIYNFQVVPGGHVTVGFVKAIGIPEEAIEYELKPDGESSLPAQFHIDKSTGELTLNGQIQVGDYKAVAHAIGISSKAEATANVAISVYIETETEDVLIVHTIVENKSNSFLLPCPNGQTTCIYKYLDHYPVTDETLFHYENGYLKIDPITLEMDQIKNLLNPQFTVNLQLISDEGSEANEMIQSSTDENRHWLYLPEKLPRNPNNLLVSVIIKDDNDHNPVFEIGSKLTVGYPMKNLLNAISPPYLVKVEATDKDKGINADIRYTTSETDIIVHPKTGIVYPGGNAFDGNVNRKFSIVATDMDGQDGGHSTTLEVEVVLLSEQHLAFLTLNNRALEDVDNIIKELSQETNLNINYLTASIIPIGQENSLYSYIKKLTSTKQDQNYSIRMVIYALTLDNKPVPADTLNDSLEEVDESFKTENWRSSCGANDTNDELTNTTGYIAGIAVLASLLIIFMVVVAILYYVKIYKKRKVDSYNSMGEEDADSMKSDKSHLDKNDQKPKKRLTKYVYNSPPPEDDDSLGDNKGYDTITEKNWSSENSSPVYNDPIDIKVNNEKRSSYDLKLQIDDNVDDESKEISKSVSFKPIVEKFNIVTDAEKEDENVEVDVRL